MQGRNTDKIFLKSQNSKNLTGKLEKIRELYQKFKATLNRFKAFDKT